MTNWKEEFDRLNKAHQELSVKNDNNVLAASLAATQIEEKEKEIEFLKAEFEANIDKVYTKQEYEAQSTRIKLLEDGLREMAEQYRLMIEANNKRTGLKVALEELPTYQKCLNLLK